jgi:outer membrane protein assembly factor BamB
MAAYLLAAVLLSITNLMALEQTRSDDAWLGFRGTNGTGVAESSALPAEFGRDKNALWKTVVPFGRSSPVVARDRIFLTASEGEKLLTLALDANTGKIVWRRDLQRARHMSIFKGNDPASPSPASDGTNVYVFFAELGLISYTADGRERWRLPLGPFKSFYGMGGSPIVHDGTVLLVCDQRTGSFIIAVDAQTGKPRWKQERPSYIEGFSTPVIYRTSQGPPQVIVQGSGLLDAYSLTTGERLWWVRQVGSYPKGVPAIGAERVIVTAQGADEPMFPPFEVSLKESDENHDGLLQFEEAKKKHPEAAEHWGWVDANGDGAVDRAEYDLIRSSNAMGHGLMAIRLEGGSRDATEARTAWRIQKQYPNVASPLLYRDVVYTVKDGGVVMSVDAVKGDVLKTGRLEGALEEYFSSPVAADGKVFMTSVSCKVSVLCAGAQWELLKVNDLGEECWATPAIARNRIFVRTRTTVYAFGNAAGS